MFSYVDASKWVAVCTTASLGVGLATVLVPRAAIAFDSRLAENVTVQINGRDYPGGSGVIVGREGDRYWVLTALHVVCDSIEGQEPITCREDVAEYRGYQIRTASGQEYEMTNIQPLQQTLNDPELALVQFESSRDYPLATLGDSDQAQLASWIYVAGFPAAFDTVGANRDFYLTVGSFSGRKQEVTEGYSMVHTAITRIGMSGGPIFDSDTRVIAIHGRGGMEVGGEVMIETETGPGNRTETEQENRTPRVLEVTTKSGFNGGIPIATFMQLRQTQQVRVPNLNQDNAPASQTPANIANPQTAEDHYQRGLNDLSEGNAHSAQEHFERALTMNSNLEGVEFLYFQQGNFYLAQGDYHGAIEKFTAAIAAKNDLGIAYTNRAVARIQLRDYAAAVEDLTAAIANGDYDARTHYNRGVAHARRGNL
ncbi:serine protease, partial [Geitlerinema sp. P-1104]|uniref:tetratricopeptide repeat-containing S1 family peptidase n=1 Tax=Geitlerinema sp. P-1104 TaxID=2546230 RepID=UPI0014772005